MPKALLQQCADLGITVEIVDGSKILARPRPPAELLEQMKAKRNEIIAHLAPPYLDEEAFAIDVLKVAEALMLKFPDVDATDLFNDVANGGDPYELARWVVHTFKAKVKQ